MSNTLKFSIVFIVVSLHTLRNASLLGYMVVYIPVAAYVTVQFIARISRSRSHPGNWGPFAAFTTVTILGFMVSLALISPASAVFGLSRILFALPVFFALYLYTDSEIQLLKNVKVFVIFFAIASLSVPLQELTGPISWFAAPTERAGLDRYASLSGSLTSLGIAVGCYIVLAQVLSGTLRYAAILVMGISAATSLSKSAIANIVIAALLVVYLNRKHLSKITVFAAIFLSALGGAYSLVPYVSERVDSVLVSFGVSNSNVVNYDDTFVESMWRRMTELPLENFAVLTDLGSPLVYLVGGGFGMASTSLVPQSDSLAPMAHNQFAENLTVFGFIGGAVMTGIMLVIQLRLFKLARSGDQIASVVGASYFILMINSLFANGTYYQPSIAVVFLLALYLVIVRRVGKETAFDITASAQTRQAKVV